MKNWYSPRWFEIFLETIQPTQMETEVQFIARQLPLSRYKNILDLCCGEGRHAGLLAQKGYEVTGIDRDADALNRAEKISGAKVRYVEMDMRYLSDLLGSFDAVVNLWQSFGYFDEATNLDVLKQISQKLTPHGRLILDIYHRNFFEHYQGIRAIERNGIVITEKKFMTGNRLTVELDYGLSCQPDKFEWQLYTPDEICSLASELGLRCLLVCTGFNEKKPATPKNPRMQLVFEKLTEQK